jgi:hypothetical protein
MTLWYQCFCLPCLLTSQSDVWLSAVAFLSFAVRILGLVVLPIVTIICAALAALAIIKSAQTCCGLTLWKKLCCHWRRRRERRNPGDISDPSSDAPGVGNDRAGLGRLGMDQSASSNFATGARVGDLAGASSRSGTVPHRTLQDTSFWELYRERYAALQRLPLHSELHSGDEGRHRELQLMPVIGRTSTAAGSIEVSAVATDHHRSQGISPWASVLAGALAAVSAGQRWHPDELTKEVAGEVLATWEDVYYAQQLWKLKVRVGSVVSSLCR